MKSVLVIFLTIFAFSNGQLINDQLRAFLENFRDNMACMEPPLAPLLIEHIDLSTDVDGAITTDGYLENVIIDNLNTYEVVHVNFNLIGLRIQFHLTVAELPINGFYSLRGSASGFPFTGEGDFTVIAYDVDIQGELQLNTLTGGFMNMQRFDSVLKAGNFFMNFENLISENAATQDFLNRVLERMALEILDIHEESVSAAISGLVLPLANSQLNNITLTEFLENITNPGEPGEPCIPPTLLLPIQP